MLKENTGKPRRLVPLDLSEVVSKRYDGLMDSYYDEFKDSDFSDKAAKEDELITLRLDYVADDSGEFGTSNRWVRNKIKLLEIEIENAETAQKVDKKPDYKKEVGALIKLSGMPINMMTTTVAEYYTTRGMMSQQPQQQ